MLVFQAVSFQEVPIQEVDTTSILAVAQWRLIAVVDDDDLKGAIRNAVQ